MSNMWNDEDDFRDNPADEVDNNGMPLFAPPPIPISESQKKAIAQNRAARAAATQPVAPQQEPEYEIPEVDLEEEDYTSVLSDARHRLELGRLWEMIINHDLFEGADADPVAAKHVQSEIRKFAKERIEVMLGMRRDTSVVERLEIDFPFNAVEVKVLKMIAKTASKGASENSDAFVPEVTRTTEEIPNIPKKEGLNKIGVKKAPAKPAPVAQTKSPAPQAQKPLPNKAPSAFLREKAASVGLNAAEASLLEPDYKPLEKPLEQMTEAEKMERFRETNERLKNRKTVKSAYALPQPTAFQEEILAQEHVLSAVSDPKGAVANLLNIINAQPKK